MNEYKKIGKSKEKDTRRKNLGLLLNYVQVDKILFIAWMKRKRVKGEFGCLCNGLWLSCQRCVCVSRAADSHRATYIHLRLPKRPRRPHRGSSHSRKRQSEKPSSVVDAVNPGKDTTPRLSFCLEL